MKRDTCSEDQLGSLKASYGPSRENGMLLLIAMAALALGGVALLILGLGQDIVRDRVVMVGGGLLVLLLGGLLFLVYWRERRLGVEVYAEGFIYTDRRNRRHVYGWDDVAEVYESIIYRRPGYSTRAAGAKYMIRQPDGRQVKLGVSIQNIRQLGATIQSEVGKRLLPQAIATYREGGTVAFGPDLSLGRGGPVCDGEMLPWTEVERIILRGGVQIRQKGKRRPWKSIPSWQIANYSVLKELTGAINLTLDGQQQAGSIHTASASGTGTPSGGIGDISARIGYDVRELLMQGYSMREIQGILRGEYDVQGLLGQKPGQVSKRK